MYNDCRADVLRNNFSQLKARCDALASSSSSHIEAGRLVLQCVAVCCSVLQCVAVRWLLLFLLMLRQVGLCCSMLQYVAVCCSVLQCVGSVCFFSY